MKIIVTIPAYNESRKIGFVIQRIKKVMIKGKYNFKILVVDDGSKDDTVEVAKKAGAVVYSNGINLGLAETFRTEMRKCVEMGADCIVHIDADGQYRPEQIPRLIEKFKEGYDFVLGSRFKGKIEYMPFLKKMGNRAFSKVISKIIRKKITDCQTGFRVFSKEIAESIEIVSDHTYTQEQIIKVVRGGFRVCEVPVYFAKRKDKSRLMRNPFEYAFRAWVNLLRIFRDYAPLKFFGIFGAIMIFLAVVIGLYFVVLHFTSGINGHLGLMFLMMLLFFTGVQVILFGFFADMKKS